MNDDTTIEAAASETTLQQPAYGEHWAGQGGIYCGTQPAMHGLPARHLIFSTEEAPERLAWGPYGEKVPGCDSRVDGRANTAAILAHKAGTGNAYPATEWAVAYSADGHTDFHLPSQADLFMASLCAPKAFNPNSWHWNSTQTGPTTAFVQDFETGDSGWSLKGLTYRVRAVRWILLSA